MPVVNPLARELVFKIVYYGPGLGGKTTTLQHIHAATKPEHRGKMVSLATPVDRTLYFDFLPIRVPNVRGMGVRLQLFTVPGQVYYNATRKLVLTGADGVVLVVDSQRLRLDSSLESLQNLRDNLREHGRSLPDLPFVIQYNKRDLPDLVPIEELEQRMNPGAAPSFSTVATRGPGVFESLEAITRAVLDDFARRIPESRATSPRDLELPEGGLVEALRLAESDQPLPASQAVVARPRTDLDQRGSITLGLSSAPDADPGEAAARAISDAGALPRGAPAPGASAPASSVARESEPRASSDAVQSEDIVASRAPSDPTSAPRTPRTSGEPSATPPAARDTRPPETRQSLSPAALQRPSAPALLPPPPEAARSSAPPPEQGPSFAALWSGAERVTVVELEQAIVEGRAANAVALAEQLVSRALASAASLLGATPETPRDPAVVALLLGLDGRRYLEFRALVRDARAGGLPTRVEVLAAYAFAIEARTLRARLRV